MLFTWSRIPGDNGSNTTYRLFVQDLSRETVAFDVYTTANFYGGYFKAEGARYDALVVANPGPSQVVGPAVGFLVAGQSPTAPTMVQPAHNSTVRPGNIQLGWSPVPGATLYEYFVASGERLSAGARRDAGPASCRCRCRASDDSPTAVQRDRPRLPGRCDAAPSARTPAGAPGRTSPARA